MTNNKRPRRGAARAGSEVDAHNFNGHEYNPDANQKLGVELGDERVTPPEPNPLLDAVYPQLSLGQMLQIPRIYELNNDCWAKISLAPPCKLNAALERACQDFADEHDEAFVIVDPNLRVLVYREPKSWAAQHKGSAYCVI